MKSSRFEPSACDPDLKKTKTILQIRELAFQRSANWLFEGVDLSLKEGEICGILGPSGVGKSTLLNIIMGQLQPTRGQVELRCDFCWMPQDLALVPSLSAQTNVMLSKLIGTEQDHTGKALGQILKLSSSDVPKEVSWLLEELGLKADLHNRKVSQLSGGEQARVAVARVLWSPACLMIFDEPISHLDWDRASEVLQIIKNHCAKEKRAAILVLHDPHFAEKFCDQILNLRTLSVSYSAKSIHLDNRG